VGRVLKDQGPGPAVDVRELLGEFVGFAASAETEIGRETNVLLVLLAVLGFAVAVATAVIIGAAWKGWDVLWGSSWRV
jgi:hypothetical protein